MESTRKFKVIRHLVSQRMEQADIQEMLEDLPTDSRDVFRESVAEILEKVSFLMEVRARVADTLELGALLATILETTVDAVAAERGTIFLYDEHTEELFSRVATSGLTREIRIPSDQGIAGRVFQSGRAIHVEDAYDNPLFNSEVDRETGFRTRSVLCVPVRAPTAGSTLVGVLQVLNKRGGEFSTADCELLEAIAAQAASALRNAKLHEEVNRARQRQIDLRDAALEMFGETDLDALLEKIVATTTRLLDADRTTLFINDDVTQELWSRISEGLHVGEEIRIANGSGIAGAVFQSGLGENIRDAYEDPRFNRAPDESTGYRTSSILTAPITTKDGRRVGVFQVLNKKNGLFDTTDEEVLQALAAQAALALDNAQLFDQVGDVLGMIEDLDERVRDLVTD